MLSYTIAKTGLDNLLNSGASADTIADYLAAPAVEAALLSGKN